MFYVNNILLAVNSILYLNERPNVFQIDGFGAVWFNKARKTEESANRADMPAKSSVQRKTIVVHRSVLNV